jgi:hypothetical protein
LQDDWPLWRLVLEKVATKQELDTHWSIDDVADANEALDAQYEAQAEMNQRK